MAFLDINVVLLFHQSVDDFVLGLHGLHFGSFFLALKLPCTCLLNCTHELDGWLQVLCSTWTSIHLDLLILLTTRDTFCLLRFQTSGKN